MKISLKESWFIMNYEKKIIKALRLKDNVMFETVFEEIYMEYHGLIVYIISKYETNKQNIEEIVNDVFYSFYNAILKTRIKNIKYYLVKSAKNKTLDFLSKKHIDLVYDEDIVLKHLCIDDESKYNDTIRKMEKVLSEYEINIIILHDVYDYSFKELSKKYNKPFSSINSTYHRAIIKFKEAYNES